jgi:hypothetical protein
MPTSPLKRSIRFRDDEHLCEYHAGAVLDLIECHKEIWFQQADMSIIKRKALLVSKEAHKHGVGSLLSNTYGSSQSTETQEALNSWCRNANARRGLERWINDEYSAKRSDIRRRTIQSVLRAQQKMREENINDVDYGVKVISRLSEAFSQDSRCFAISMGRADEHAAMTEPDEATTTKTDSFSSMKISSRAPSPRSVIASRRPRSSLGLQASAATDFRNFV